MTLPEGPDELASFTVSREGQVRVVALSGEVDDSNAEALLGRLLAAVPPPATQPGQAAQPPPVGPVVVDLSLVRYLGSSGLRLLARLEQALRVGGGVLAVVTPDGTISARVLELTGMAEYLDAHPSREAAVDALASRSRDPG